MKNKIKFILLIILIIPVFINAKVTTHEEAISKSNSYILNDVYNTRSKFLLLNNPTSNETSYKNGGLLTLKDYKSTVKNFDSWLIIPNKFWYAPSSKLFPDE